MLSGSVESICATLKDSVFKKGEIMREAVDCVCDEITSLISPQSSSAAMEMHQALRVILKEGLSKHDVEVVDCVLQKTGQFGLGPRGWVVDGVLMVEYMKNYSDDDSYMFFKHKTRPGDFLSALITGIQMNDVDSVRILRKQFGPEALTITRSFLSDFALDEVFSIVLEGSNLATAVADLGHFCIFNPTMPDLVFLEKVWRMSCEDQKEHVYLPSRIQIENVLDEKFYHAPVWGSVRSKKNLQAQLDEGELDAIRTHTPKKM